MVSGTKPETSPVPKPGGEVTPAAPGSSPVRWLLRAAILLAIVWGITLFSLTLLTANPLRLNRQQLMQADLIVTARPAGPGQLAVRKEWTSGASLGQVEVRDLAELSSDHPDWIVPLIRKAGHYEVARARFRIPRPGARGRVRYEYRYGPPLVYPLTKETERQLEEIIGEMRTDGSSE